MRDMLCDTELDVCEATDFTTVFQNLDQVRLLGMVLCKEIFVTKEGGHF